VAAASSALCGGFRFGERDVVDHTVVLPKAADRVRAARLANLLVRTFLASVPTRPVPDKDKGHRAGGYAAAEGGRRCG